MTCSLSCLPPGPSIASPGTAERLAVATVASFNCATMCYMGNTEGKVQRVGVRELRQNLSRYLRLVAGGGRFEVTEHNLPVAVLGPLPGHSSPLARLIAEDRIVPARLDLTELGPPPEQPREMTMAEALAAQREERCPDGRRAPLFGLLGSGQAGAARGGKRSLAR